MYVHARVCLCVRVVLHSCTIDDLRNHPLTCKYLHVFMCASSHERTSTSPRTHRAVSQLQLGQPPPDNPRFPAWVRLVLASPVSLTPSCFAANALPPLLSSLAHCISPMTNPGVISGFFAALNAVRLCVSEGGWAGGWEEKERERECVGGKGRGIGFKRGRGG